jgi:hypothetical protein
MQKYKEGEIHFNLMGVVEDKIARYNRSVCSSNQCLKQKGRLLHRYSRFFLAVSTLKSLLAIRLTLCFKLMDLVIN